MTITFSEAVSGWAAISAGGSLFGTGLGSTTTVGVSAYDVLATDEMLHTTYSPSGAITIDLKTAQLIDGRVVHIKDAGGNAGSNNITITTEGSETIDGSSTASITDNYGALSIYSDGTNWFTY